MSTALPDTAGRPMVTAGRPSDPELGVGPFSGRSSTFLILALSIAGLMTVFEAAKQWVHPDITLWQSHAVTVLFAAAIGAVVGYIVLRKQDALYQAILDEARGREAASAETAAANIRLQDALEASRAAQRQLQILAQTIRSISECISVTDMDDRVLFVNKAFLDTYGYDESDLLGKSIAVVRSARTPADVARAVLPATLSGGWRGEMWNRRKDGTDFQISLSTAIVRDESGVPSALVGVARDITEEKRTEEALKRGRESESIVSLAGGIAHEFNNLIQSIMATTSLAMDEVPPGHPARGTLQGVLSASERAANLTSQLLAYAGRGAFVTPVDLDVNDVIRGSIPAFTPLLPAGTSIALDLSPAMPTIRADRRLIEQVLRALVTNAAEAMAGRTGSISLRTRIADLPSIERHGWVTSEGPTPGRYLLLSVEDQGTGIEARTLARIFDPFFSTKFLGRGMGLPAVLGIARSMGGSVAVDSEPGVGTCVIVALPVTLKPAA